MACTAGLVALAVAGAAKAVEMVEKEKSPVIRTRQAESLRIVITSQGELPERGVFLPDIIDGHKY